MCTAAENPNIRLARGLFAPLASRDAPPVANALVALGIERREHRGSQYLIKHWGNTILP